MQPIKKFVALKNENTAIALMLLLILESAPLETEIVTGSVTGTGLTTSGPMDSLWMITTRCFTHNRASVQSAGVRPLNREDSLLITIILPAQLEGFSVLGVTPRSDTSKKTPT